MRSTPEAEGLSSAKLTELYRFLSKPEMGLHSFLVIRHKKVAAEGYWAPYAQEKPHTLFSASKSFTGLAVGFAAQDGLLSLDDRVVDFFPEYLPEKTCANMEKMRVRHLLTMSTGFLKDPHDFPWPRPDDVCGIGPHCCHDGVPVKPIDWVRNFFDHYVPYEPGTEFAYCTHGTYMLSVIVQKVTGRTVSDYMNEKLFRPMGIGEPSWELGPDGCTVGGWGLMLTTEQLAAVGQFLSDGGSWNGKQLLSEEWVRQATTVQIGLGRIQDPHTAGYGYQIWVDEREHAFMFRGAFGQICLAVPDKDMVIAYTGAAGSAERQQALEKIWELAIEAAGESENASEAEVSGKAEGRGAGAGDSSEAEKAAEDALKELRGYTSSLEIPCPQGHASFEEEAAARFGGKRYLLGDNRLNFTEFSMTFASAPGEHDTLTLGLNGRTFTVPVGYGEWLRGKTCVTTAETDTDVSVIFENVSCRGAWADGVYHLTMCFDETSYVNTMKIRFQPGGVVIKHSRNCSFFPAVNCMLTGVETEKIPY